jgi:BlaI family transcriptional regulator, penicillinase repressor
MNQGTTKMAKERELPPPLEMACLNALWELGEGNVEEVRVVVSRARPLAYTTVLTLLDRLSRRGAVSRRKEGRGFRYQPSIDRDKLRRLALGQFLEHHFGGSVANLRLFLEMEPEAETAADAMAASAGAIGADAHAQSAWAASGSSAPNSET